MSAAQEGVCASLLQALKLGDIGEGETELMDQLIARPELQQRWRETMDNSKLTRGTLLPTLFHVQRQSAVLLCSTALYDP